MTTEIQTLTAGDSLPAASRLLNERGFRHVPILDEARQFVGLVSQSDVVTNYASKLASEPADRRPAEIRFGEFMTREVETVDERANMRQAALHLQRNNFRCLPVVTAGQLEGIVTDADFVGVAINLLEQRERQDFDEV